ncbi:CheR family methyltransferase [Enterococcus sp.]|uniref:CheR family methyltransferase n=1 Tax=Enterococcus sp. TaxID=35783 RepID=UPI002FC6AF1B
MTLNFEFFNQWVEQKLGIQLEAYKERQMQRRIGNIMQTAGVSTLEAYAKLLETNPQAKQEFLSHITINVTEFYRNKDLFEAFEKQIIRKSQEGKALKIWSAACSIGSEPYTLSMILNNHNIRKAQIVATDIDQNCLVRGRSGLYKASEVKNIPSDELKKHFTVVNDDYQAQAHLKQRIQFKKHDLLVDPYEKKCDVIVCRNVTIYFKNEARDAVYQKFSDVLEPGGILFTGATETINFSERFGLEKIDSFIYQKIG